MSTQRKFNYSFRNRNRNITEPKESEQNKTEASPMNSKNSEPKPEEIKTSPGPSFPSDCEPEPLGCQKLPDPDQPISAADLEHRKGAIRDEMFIQDMFVMDQIEEIRGKMDNLAITARSRSKSSSNLGCAFEPQDRLFLDALEKCQDQMLTLKRLEYRRYPDSSYGTFEKTRRCFLVNDLDEILKKFDSMIKQQKELLRKEFDFHDSQMFLINSSLSCSKDERERRAGAFLHTMREY